MNDLTIGKVITSLEVAEMIGKDHSNLLKDIRRYTEQSAEVKIDLGEFFIETTYQDANNQERPCYQVTRKGCEFISNKLTGIKGTEFTAKYINKFHEMKDIINEIPTGSNLIALAVIEAQKMLEQKDNIIAQQTQVIGELKPKADYTDTILKSTSLVTINQIAKDYGISGQALNAILHTEKVQYKQSDQWLLYAAHQACGYTHSQTINITRSDGSADVKMNTKWTQKGRLFIYNLLKSTGLIPVIERSKGQCYSNVGIADFKR